MSAVARDAFRFYTRLTLTRLTGLRASDLAELMEHLRPVPPSVVFHHTHPRASTTPPTPDPEILSSLARRALRARRSVRKLSVEAGARRAGGTCAGCGSRRATGAPRGDLSIAETQRSRGDATFAAGGEREPR